MPAKLLIANRGEIAVRIIRAARELGLHTIAVYEPDEQNSLHVLLADEAYQVNSYLSIDDILYIAEKSKTDLVHPGYGFLAENYLFAKRVVDEGYIFIGPDPDIIRIMADKVESKKLAHKLGLPTLPWRSVSSLDEALKVADDIGYPVVLKAAEGGGGIGIRAIYDPEELEKVYHLAVREVERSFKSRKMYIEKLLVKPRHIEVQVLGDNYGNVVHLYERECSIQRRKQKIIEEAPSVALREDERLELASAARRFAEKLGYSNAGTLEFLYSSGSYYFLEMNTRIQVEHGVTELVTGVDVVKNQILVALDKPLNFSQGDVKLRGYAIEARINAENPLEYFKPSPGVLKYYREPSGPWVRVDSGVTRGMEITTKYSPLIAKVLTWGSTREEAIARMRRALAEYIVSGVETNIPILREIFEDPDYVRGDIYTTFLEEKMSTYIEKIKKKLVEKALLVALVKHRSRENNKHRSHNHFSTRRRWLYTHTYGFIGDLE